MIWSEQDNHVVRGSAGMRTNPPANIIWYFIAAKRGVTICPEERAWSRNLAESQTNAMDMRFHKETLYFLFSHVSITILIYCYLYEPIFQDDFGSEAPPLVETLLSASLSSFDQRAAV